MTTQISPSTTPPLTRLAQAPIKTATPKMHLTSTIRAQPSFMPSSFELELKKKIQGNSYIKWNKENQIFSVIVEKFPAPISVTCNSFQSGWDDCRKALYDRFNSSKESPRVVLCDLLKSSEGSTQEALCDLLKSNQDHSHEVLCDLLNYKAPTKQASDGALIWDFTFKEMKSFVGRRSCSNFPAGAEILYPQFLFNPQAMIIECPDNADAFFDVNDIFASEASIEFTRDSQGVYWIRTREDTEGASSSIWGKCWKAITGIAEPMNSTYYILSVLQTSEEKHEVKKEEKVGKNSRNCTWKLKAYQLKKFALLYYERLKKENKLALLEVKQKPITCQYCIESFNHIVKQYSLSPIVFDLYQEQMIIPFSGKQWDDLFIFMPTLATLSADKKNWIVDRKNIVAFFEYLKLKSTHQDSFAKFLQTLGFEETEIVYGPSGLTMFFSSATSSFSLIDKLQAQSLGTKIDAIAKDSNYRKGLRISKQELPKFIELLAISEQMQKWINTKMIQ